MFVRSRTIIAFLLTCLFLTLYLWIGRASRLDRLGYSESARSNVTVDTVSVKLKNDTVTWLPKLFPEWNHKIYVVDDDTAPLTVPKNKGRESMAYLTYIIDNYDHLPDFTLFLHAKRFQWHNDDPDYDGYAVLNRLRLEHVRKEGYVSLRCAWVVGCPYEIRPYGDLMTTEEKKAPNRAYKQAFEEMFPGQEVPKTVGAPCCAQFAVSREKLQARPKRDYIRYRDWLVDTDLEDYVSGRIFEYSWHIIFNKPAINCPTPGQCYCQLFGLCDLKCNEASCVGRYDLPRYSTLPQGWPYIDWNGRSRRFEGPYDLA